MKKDLNMPTLQFPPYGIMDNDYLKNLGSKNLAASPAEPVVPPDFQPEVCDSEERERLWIGFRELTLGEIADAIWPVWDEAHRRWSGMASKTMHVLTCADLMILLRLRVGPRLPINSMPSSKARAINCPTHLAYFKEEDQAKIFDSYAYYDRTLDPKFASIFSGAFFAGMDAKCSSTQLQFKRRLQRPRAYQVALLMGIEEFNLEEASSSMTPSMVSGHSLQGLLGTGAVMEQIIKLGITFDEDNWQALRQYAVDIGDRRVMAGVHYPSDNLASWIVFMRLAPHVFRNGEVKNHLWQAITEQSLVYRHIHESESDAYRPGLELLNKMRPAGHE